MSMFDFIAYVNESCVISRVYMVLIVPFMLVALVELKNDKEKAFPSGFSTNIVEHGCTPLSVNHA